ncbi:MAG: PCRF domain-containing protein, partial [Eubacterium sp.]
MEAPDFWNDPEESSKKTQELKSKKDDIAVYQKLKGLMEDMEVMIEMGNEENDPSVIPELEAMTEDLKQTMEETKVKTLLSGEYDRTNAIVTLHSG